jgi:hypothetical protein
VSRFWKSTKLDNKKYNDQLKLIFDNIGEAPKSIIIKKS